MSNNGGGRIAMTSPEYFEVSYAINPWMHPDAWARDPISANRTAQAQWHGLKAALEAVGLSVDVIPGVGGLPDMLFPANSAIVLDRRALLARFRHSQRTGEEVHFRRYFEGLVARGLLDEVAEFTLQLVQEGAGDCIWDASRGLFWAGFGPRSDAWALSQVTDFFQRPVIALLLATPEYYHLDTCFTALPGGEVLYYPGAFAERSAQLIESMVPAEKRIAVTPEEAATFALNTVASGRDLVMASPPPRVRAVLEERGYRCHAVDLSAFMMSGGAAYCMTLRLDLATYPHAAHAGQGELPCTPSTSTIHP